MHKLNVKAKRARSFLTLLRMGHCAPTVMQTIVGQEWLVRLTTGLPGGIGSTGGECGGLTSPLIFLGLRHGLNEVDQGLPVVFDQGHAYCQRFFDENASLLCKEIQGRCVHAVCYAPGLLAETLAADYAIPSEQREAYTRLYGHLTDKGFHCAHAVFRQLEQPVS